ncbi:MAG: RNA polymerase sigma-70 factor [Bacteroidales bacterium]
MNLINGIEESKLILMLSEGDKTAFEILFKHYYPGLVIYASKFVQDRSEAEEIVQEFFIRLWEKHHKIKSSSTLKSYVFQSVKNSSLNFIRDKKVSLPIIEELVQSSNSELIFNPDLYVASELQQKIESAVNSLPEKCREVFLMSRFRNMKNDEIAQELNISKRTVETHISNAIKVLKTELKEFLMLLIMLKLG